MCELQKAADELKRSIFVENQYFFVISIEKNLVF